MLLIPRRSSNAFVVRCLDLKALSQILLDHYSDRRGLTFARHTNHRIHKSPHIKKLDNSIHVRKLLRPRVSSRLPKQSAEFQSFSYGCRRKMEILLLCITNLLRKPLSLVPIAHTNISAHDPAARAISKDVEERCFACSGCPLPMIRNIRYRSLQRSGHTIKAVIVPGLIHPSMPSKIIFCPCLMGTS